MTISFLSLYDVIAMHGDKIIGDRSKIASFRYKNEIISKKIGIDLYMSFFCTFAVAKVQKIIG